MTTFKIDLGALAHVVTTGEAPAPAVEPLVVDVPVAIAPELASEFVPPAPPEHEPEPWYKRAFNVVRGVGALGKTALGAGSVAAMGLLDRFDFVDVMSTVKGWLGDSERAGTIMVIVGVLIMGAKIGFTLFGGGNASRGIDDGE